jgi:hypothetical protein
MVSQNARCLKVLIKVTYHGFLDNDQKARPIIFSHVAFEGQQWWHYGFRLYYHRNNTWRRPEDDVDDAFLVVDDPDMFRSMLVETSICGLGPGDS